MLYLISRTIFEVFIRLFFRISIKGTENIPEPPFIVAANHASHIDPPLVAVALRRHRINFMAKQELFDIPVIGRWTRSVCCIPAKRGRNSIRGIKEAGKRLKNGRVVGIFPEGTRSLDGMLQKGKKGAGFLIAIADVPVLPVYIRNSGKAFSPGKKKINYGTRVEVIIGRPASPEELSVRRDVRKQDYRSITASLMQKISELMTC